MQLFLQLVVVFALLSSALAGRGSAAAAPVKDRNVIEKSLDLVSTLTKGHSLKAEVKDTETGGLEGLNVKLTAPFKFSEYVVGVKASIGDLRKLAPDTIFVNRKWDAADGSLDVEADFDVKDHSVDVATKWTNKHMSLNAKGNSQDLVTQVGAKTQHVFDSASRNLKATVSGVYDILTKKVSASTRVDVDGASAELSYDTEKEDPVLKVTYDVGKHQVQPKISLKSGDITYGYRHNLANGNLDTTLHPGDNVVVEWTDKSATGSWKTKVDVPLQDQSKTKVSFARDWAL